MVMVEMHASEPSGEPDRRSPQLPRIEARFEVTKAAAAGFLRRLVQRETA
jgi:hypothetical protein